VTEPRGQRVHDELIPAPREVDVGEGWRLELIGQHQSMLFVVARLTLQPQSTHSLQVSDEVVVATVVEGDGVRVSWGSGEARYGYAETWVMPASLSDCQIHAEGDQSVMVVMGRLA
jgi:hypothetical protein